MTKKQKHALVVKSLIAAFRRGIRDDSTPPKLTIDLIRDLTIRAKLCHGKK